MTDWIGVDIATDSRGSVGEPKTRRRDCIEKRASREVDTAGVAEGSRVDGACWADGLQSGRQG